MKKKILVVAFAMFLLIGTAVSATTKLQFSTNIKKHNVVMKKVAHKHVNKNNGVAKKSKIVKNHKSVNSNSTQTNTHYTNYNENNHVTTTDHYNNSNKHGGGYH